MRPVVKIEQDLFINGADYPAARLKFLDQIGAYCSYCEQPVSNDSGVEHKLAKATYPFLQDSVEYLLLACEMCNSVKGRKPEASSFTAALDKWVWPDRTVLKKRPTVPRPPPDETYLLLEHFIALKSQDDLKHDKLLPATSPGSTTQYNMVWIRPNAHYAPPGSPTEAKVLRTIQELTLNAYQPDLRTATNQRVANRWRAYQAAEASHQALWTFWQDFAPASVDAPEVFLMVRSIRETMLSTGFWTLWFDHFRAQLDAPKSGNPWFGVAKTVRERLLFHTLVWLYPQERPSLAAMPVPVLVPVIPGTDDSRLHLGTFS